jgi:hypothetical protein
VPVDLFLRISGLMMIAGGSLAALGWIGFALLDPRHGATTASTWFPLNAAVVLGGTLMAIGLPGMYLLHATPAGAIGLVALVILFLGLVGAYVGVHAIETATAPDVPPRMMAFVAVAAPALFVGTVLTAAAMVVGGVYPMWQALASVVAALLGLSAQVRPTPPLLGRGVFPAAYALTMVAIGATIVDRAVT